jgi:hypothetical protein
MWVFAFAYSWLVAIIVRKSLPATLAWMFLGLAAISAAKVVIRSNSTVIDPQSLIDIMRGVELITALTACTAVVQLANMYNGNMRIRLPIREQLRILHDAFRPQEVNHEAGAGSFVRHDSDGH